MFGRISEFDPEKEEWAQYSQRLTHFFAANGVEEAGQKREILLSMIGPATFKLLSNLVVPDNPGDKTYKEPVDALKNHHNSVLSEIVQHLQFYSRDRRPEESVSTFVAELLALAVHCNFGASLDKMLRDRLVGGINNIHIRRCLLQEKNLTFQKALEIAQALEVADKDERKLVANTSAEPVQRLQDSKSRSAPRAACKDDALECYRCGKQNHKASNCRFKSVRCHNCGKIGHLKAICRQSAKGDRREQVKQISEEQKEDSKPDEYTLYSLEDNNNRQPFLVQLQIDGVPLTMELDTGASLSLMSKTTFHKHWPNRSLQATTRKLRTYTGETIGVLGTAQVCVTHGKNSADLELMVVDLDGPSLLIRNWLNQLTLDWSVLHYMHEGALGEMLRKHSRVFRSELGTLHGFQAKIHVNLDTVPMFCSARPVPYSMRPLVEEELEKLVSQGVMNQ